MWFSIFRREPERLREAECWREAEWPFAAAGFRRDSRRYRYEVGQLHYGWGFTD